LPFPSQVGYTIRFEDVTGTNTILKYMTDGAQGLNREPEGVRAGREHKGRSHGVGGCVGGCLDGVRSL
jgi:hypothetical protein